MDPAVSCCVLWLACSRPTVAARPLMPLPMATGLLSRWVVCCRCPWVGPRLWLLKPREPLPFFLSPNLWDPKFFRKPSRGPRLHPGRRRWCHPSEACRERGGRPLPADCRGAQLEMAGWEGSSWWGSTRQGYHGKFMG